MAKVLSDAGSYVANPAARKKRRFLLLGMAALTVLSLVEGFFLSLYFHPEGFLESQKMSLIIVVGLSVVLLLRLGGRKLEELDKTEANYRRGAEGEHTVGQILAKLSDDFSVINDLRTPFGTLGHVVVGKTGVFVLDTKNWRGVVSADGHRDLLLNGRPTDKAGLGRFTARLMEVRASIKKLAPAAAPFPQGVFVFTSARIEAKWGTTGVVHCVSKAQLYDYLVERDYGKGLKKQEVDQIARAFLALAQMDPECAPAPEAAPVGSLGLASGEWQMANG